VLTGVERELMDRRPALLVVYGDVNSTLGAALAAAKLGVLTAHVEAGLRSFDNTMPEEINRRLTDQLCDLLFATSADAVGHLAREGVAGESVHLVGNTMIDTLVACLDRLDAEAARTAMGLPGRYIVATLHRPFNVDDPAATARLVAAMHEVADKTDVIMPVHPRGAAAFEAAGLGDHPGVRTCEPLGYLEFMTLVRGASAAITDSAGVQEETTFLRVPCLTLRPVTERPVTVTSGSNRLVTADELPSAVQEALDLGRYSGELPPLWDGAAGPRIAGIITRWLSGQRFTPPGRGSRAAGTRPAPYLAVSRICSARVMASRTSSSRCPRPARISRYMTVWSPEWSEKSHTAFPSTQMQRAAAARDAAGRSLLRVDSIQSTVTVPNRSVPRAAFPSGPMPALTTSDTGPSAQPSPSNR
jgi:UDP-N-acetylglucosamine 2-epimerase (non-hydrolysing)